MRKVPLLLLIIITCNYATAQYWQQEANYQIDVSLNDKDHTLDGFEKIEYINNSPDTLSFIWFHLWPNAYKNDKTAFSDQLLENGNTSFYFSDRETKGYINRLDFKVNNITAATEDHPQYIDIIKLVLPESLAPGKSITITTPFHVRLPFNVSRGGYDGESYQVTQWYPKPAVYDSKGWHPMPYLDQGEFYSEFGSFNVSITLPDNYVVAATGELQEDSEKEFLVARANFEWKPIHRKLKTKGGSVKTITQKFPASSPNKKTIRYKQTGIHDFAWFADKRFIVNAGTIRLASGKTVTVFTYYTPSEKEWWQKSLDNAKKAIQFYSPHVGEYPYNVLSVVQGPASFGGGMEYPTITVISPIHHPKNLDLVINHEIGHNWFYGILASNERDNAWMDEGITSYYQDRWFYSAYKERTALTDRLEFEKKVLNKRDQPISTASEKFTAINYELTAYYKASEWMRYLEKQLGTAVFDKAMQDYFRQWQFKHPQPADLKKSLEESSGRNLDAAFDLLDQKGVLPNQKRTGTKIGLTISPQFYESFKNKPSKNILAIGPAVGFNSYDKLMLGVVFTNVNIPLSKFQFLVAPMYATNSGEFAGIGFVNYSLFPGSVFHKIDIGLSASKFSNNEFKKTNGEKVYFGFNKLVPGIRFTLNEKNPRSTMKRYIQFKSYFISEQAYRVRNDTVINLPDTAINQVVGKATESRTLNQIKLVIQDNRALYPYRGELKVEQGKDFVRTAFAGKYYFNYSKNGGLDLRFFVGKFFYSGARTISKQFNTDRYHLNMTGANGYEDYTYSDYFLGRNKFEGLASQQIMVRDGAFKIRTDLLGNKVGKTDDWLVAMNLSSDIPKSINPLSLLPVKIPLKVFVDIGTYAGAWERSANEDRFLFDAGIHIPVLKETINIYIPLIYSRVFKDYVESYLPQKNKFFRTISFSIDISNFSFSKFNRELDY